jgi:S1-C subfamily serine protease
MPGLTITINGSSIAVIRDREHNRPIGTGFVFVRPSWIVTAKHVVIRDGILRENLDLIFTSQNNYLPASLLYAHPTLDLAVLSAPDSPCETPLYPAHHEFVGKEGFITVGYKPSKNTANGFSVEANTVPSFTIELRERADGNEEVLIFPANFAEGGHSGGPVLGAGGGVVGVIIEDFSNAEGQFARASSIKPLLDRLAFRNG